MVQVIVDIRIGCNILFRSGTIQWSCPLTMPWQKYTCNIFVIENIIIVVFEMTWWPVCGSQPDFRYSRWIDFLRKPGTPPSLAQPSPTHHQAHTHTLLTLTPNLLLVTQLHYKRPLPRTNPISNSPSVQSWPKPKWADPSYAITMPSRWLWKGAMSCCLLRCKCKAH